MKDEKHHSGINRRQFVKNSGMAMGGLMLSPSLMAKAHIDGSDEIKIGLIGCGGRGTGAVVQALNSGQNVKLVAMCDAFEDNMEKCYKRITDPNFSDWTSDEPLDMRSKIDVPKEHRFSGCLLYTSPSPRDRTRSRMPSSA